MKKSFVILSIGLLMIVAGTLTLLKQPTKAATNYSATWSITKWRNIPNVWAGIAPVSVGPAAWQVAGTVGGVNYTETWEASSWQELLPCGGTPTSGSFVSLGSASKGAPKGGSSPPLQRTTGMYGASIICSDANGSSFGYYDSTSIPTSWTVTGTINN